MRTSATSARTKINVQIPADTRERLLEAALLEGKTASMLVRESIEEKIAQINRRILEEKMKAAYQGLAEENLRVSEEFKYSDAENLG
jgi:predicted DNA-binding protein